MTGDDDFEDYEDECFDDEECDEPDCDDGRLIFADPGGKSSLRAATPDNPRDRPCPQCGTPNCLTRADVALGYVCNPCADRAEGGY